ncbi:acylphosphatase [Lacticaseibacillus mingshuiensis]|uniref:acylphosphatase n=1 Tax=Lacticaseibacillus mingshuiensis TaxID=2799574 RepID=A0ABW4CGF5_9LACO|nr:acylphosphatase [Lacticaseibacillus mingshuiensis]
MTKIARSMLVSGRVQGVGFRWMAKMVADKLQITGKVENRDDGSVYIEAVGEPVNMAKFAAAIKASPTPSGRVDHYEEHALDPIPAYDRFRVTG